MHHPISSWRRVLRRPLFRLLAALTALLLIVAITFVPVVWPETDPPGRADAVIVLSGDHGERLPIAQALIDDGLVDTLVFVGTLDRAEEESLCRSQQRVEYICLRPQPDNTRTEARAAAQLAESRGWRTIVVVTSNFHVARTRILFDRCFDGNVRVMGGDPPYGRATLRRQLPAEWLKLGYTLTLARKC
ncbi:MAG TPA: YdcF family protein [Acidimicrobiales bacterium]|jgi:uncharacterized SAM-binding protein YcdF (DUF218 family)|nr:YdcF family protein [Acidimicrobiales bacterium]